MSNNVHFFYQNLLRWNSPDAATLELGQLHLWRDTLGTAVRRNNYALNNKNNPLLFIFCTHFLAPSISQYPSAIDRCLGLHEPHCPRFPLIRSCRNKWEQCVVGSGIDSYLQKQRGTMFAEGLLTQSCRNKGELWMWVSCIDSDPWVYREIHQTRSNGYHFFLSPNQHKPVVFSYYARNFRFVHTTVVTTSGT